MSTSTRSALAETLFDDHMASNMLVLGAAYQAGAIPVSADGDRGGDHAERRAVAMNTHAFRCGPAARRRSGLAVEIKRHRLGAAVEASQAR